MRRDANALFCFSGKFAIFLYHSAMFCCSQAAPLWWQGYLSSIRFVLAHLVSLPRQIQGRALWEDFGSSGFTWQHWEHVEGFTYGYLEEVHMGKCPNEWVLTMPLRIPARDSVPGDSWAGCPIFCSTYGVEGHLLFWDCNKQLILPCPS